jgi:hypothetical protein
MKILKQITQLKGFTGGELYGTHIIPTNVSFPAEATPDTQQELLIPVNGMVADNEIDREEDLEEEQAGEDRDEVVLRAYYSVMDFSYDDHGSHHDLQF